MDENELGRVVVDSAIEVHMTLGGPGLLESIYRDALGIEIRRRGIEVEREKIVPVSYKGVITYNPIFESQTLTYLRLIGLKLEMVINF